MRGNQKRKISKSVSISREFPQKVEPKNSQEMRGNQKSKMTEPASISREFPEKVETINKVEKKGKMKKKKLKLVLRENKTREMGTQTDEIILNGHKEVSVKRNKMSNLNNKMERAYCREKWGKEWFKCEKSVKNARKKMARQAIEAGWVE